MILPGNLNLKMNLNIRKGVEVFTCTYFMYDRGTRYREINLRGKTQTNRLAVLIISWRIAGFFIYKKHESEGWK